MTIPQQRESWTQVLCQCGQRLGQHRWGDDACQNPYWRAGNGLPQWLGARSFRIARAEAVGPWGAT